MVSSMLDISSIESGIGNMNFAPVDVSEMCREVTEKFRNGYRDLDIRLNAEDGIFVAGDKKHLAQTVYTIPKKVLLFDFAYAKILDITNDSGKREEI